MRLPFNAVRAVQIVLHVAAGTAYSADVDRKVEPTLCDTVATLTVDNLNCEALSSLSHCYFGHQTSDKAGIVFAQQGAWLLRRAFGGAETARLRAV